MSDDAILLARVGITGVSDFASGVAAASAAFIGLGDVFEGVSRGIGGTLDLLANVFNTATKAFTDFTSTSIAEAVKIDRYRMTLAGLYDSMEEGEKRIAYIRQYARGSLLSSDTLLELGATAEAGGLNFSKIMSTIDMLSRGNDLRARQITDALIRGGSGANMGRAMMALTRSGIGYDDLRAAGVDVSQGNHINATGGQFVQAILDIAKKKFPELGEYLKNAMQTKIVDLQDSWNQMTEAFGRAWFPMITRAINAVTPMVNFLTDTGRIEAMGKAFGDAFGKLFGAAGGESVLNRIFVFTITAIEMLPQAVEKVGSFIIRTTSTVFQFLDRAFTNMANSWQQGLVGFYNFVNTIDNAIVTFAKGWWAIGVRFTQLFGMNKGVDTDGTKLWADVNREHPNMVYKPFKGMGDILGEAIKQAGGGDILKLGDQFGTALAKNQSDFDKYLKTPKTEMPDPSTGLFNKIHQDGVEAQKKTAENTSKMAAHMADFKRFALGGGDRGQVGVTVAEMYGRGGGGGGSVRLELGKAGTHFEQGAAEVARAYQQGMRRAGMGGTQ